MIKVITGQFDNLEYDVRGIATSFYPGQEIEFVGEAEDGCGMPEGCGTDIILDLEEIFSHAYDSEKKANIGETISVADLPKNDLRKKLYAHLHERTGKTLPWGILIGIRPTKLARKFIEARTDGAITSAQSLKQETSVVPSKLIVEAAKWMQDEYLVSAEKSVLASVIAAREIKVVAGSQENVMLAEPTVYETNAIRDVDDDEDARRFSLYVGIPFCPSRCLYCSFASQPISLWENKTTQYVEALIKELEAMKQMSDEKELICSSIYVGGGTPTALPDEDFETLLEKVVELFAKNKSTQVKSKKGDADKKAADASLGIEFTVEAGRPDSITESKLEIMKRYGVNRISINPQSMNQKTLDKIGRSHNVADIKEKFELAQEKGFDNINMDIILGLPGETAKDVQHTIDEISKLRPDSLTVHALAVKRASRLNMETEGAVKFGVNEEQAAEMMRISSQGAGAMSLNPYYMYRQKNMAGNLENVGYAAEGKECYYNIVMMEEMESIIACGAGTVSKVLHNDGTIERCDTHKDPKLYIEQIEEMIRRKTSLFSEES